MRDQAFNTLEFDQLQAVVRRGAQTRMGQALADRLAPIGDLNELRRALAAVAECVELRKRGGRWSFADLADPGDWIARLRIAGAALEPLALLGLARICETALEARSAILAERATCPMLFETVAPLPRELGTLSARITKKILPGGELDDRASPELARIRHEFTRLRSKITRSLENLIRRLPDVVQDQVVTIRNDRFVIPVRADHSARLSGVAHGFSSSGATVFVEPLETIEANNELQALRGAEQREIANILFALCEELRRELPALEVAAKAVAELDFIGAKAAFAETFSCVIPEITGGPSEPSSLANVPVPPASPGRALGHPGADDVLELVQARHPLLEETLRPAGGTVVPISFKIDSTHPVMIISGANAGGKTVALKTAGLLSLMALAGLPVPTRAARVPFYQVVLADIGDRQSLAANLSTFTSHIANIASMIELCQTPALVLLDEVGTGTDPEEGSALGVAVVDHFKRHGAQVLATTHYAGLKMYAANEAGVLNASVEFDEQTLQPTYRLLVGVAGSSSGLEIAQRFGIPGKVIKNASDHVKESSRDAAAYLRRIKREAEEAEALRRALEEERAAVAEKYAALDQRFARHERERQAEFKSELAKTVDQFEKRARELISQIEDRAKRAKVEREAQRQVAELKREAQRAAQSAREAGRVSLSHGREEDLRDLPRGSRAGVSLPPQLRGVRVVRDGKVIQSGRAGAPNDEEAFGEGARESGRDSRAPREMRAPSVGDRVRLRAFGSVGVIDQIKDDEAEVRVGSLRMREKLENLDLVEEVSAARGSGRAKPSGEEARDLLRRQAQTTEVHLQAKDERGESHSRPELNLIGKTTDQAVELADKFLDQAFLSGQSQVRIIHGHGTGALRRAIAQLLEGHPHVARFSAAAPDQGGAGATIVELRQ